MHWTVSGGSPRHPPGVGTALGLAHHAALAFFSQPLAITCALLAALMYAVASVLQHREASAVPAEHSLRPGLLGRLLRSPVWLAGAAADVAGYILQFVAISAGTLVLVQPLLVCGLLFALPIGARLDGSRLSRSDWVAAAAVCVGLGVFQLVADPAPGYAFIPPRAWLVLLTIGGGIGVLLAAAGQAAKGRAKAVLLSASAGVIYGLAAGLTKTTGALLTGRGVIGMFTHWQPYALGVIGVVGVLIAQSAFQAGSLDVSLPTMSVVDPVVSIIIGAVAFGETIAGGPLAVTGEVASLIVMVLGVYGLARSSAVTGQQPPAGTETEPQHPF